MIYYGCVTSDNRYLSHVAYTGKQFGSRSQRQNVRYYARIPDPTGKKGTYRYFYTKAEYDAFMNGAKKNASAVGNNLKKTAEKIGGRVSSGISAMGNSAKNAVSQQPKRNILADAKNIASGYLDTIKSAMTKKWSQAKTSSAKLISDGKNAFNNLVGNMRDFATRAWNEVKYQAATAINSGKKLVNNLMISAGNALGDKSEVGDYLRRTGTANNMRVNADQMSIDYNRANPNRDTMSTADINQARNIMNLRNQADEMTRDLNFGTALQNDANRVGQAVTDTARNAVNAITEPVGNLARGARDFVTTTANGLANSDPERSNYAYENAQRLLSEADAYDAAGNHEYAQQLRDAAQINMEQSYALSPTNMVGRQIGDAANAAGQATTNAANAAGQTVTNMANSARDAFNQNITQPMQARNLLNQLNAAQAEGDTQMANQLFGQLAMTLAPLGINVIDYLNQNQ